ncbi:MAG TPA: DUF167 family protein [Povalibacter sp.]|nr:DUF167 family protein [Povalibacter sp.]
MPAIRWQDTSLTLDLQIQPGAARDELVGLHGERLKIRISAPPVDGRANRHLIDYLAEIFGVPRARITLLRGETGRAKTVRIDSPAKVPPEIQALQV